MTTSDNPSYKVGFGRPPVESQFKPGRSGNPAGRPKRRRSFSFDLVAALDAPASGADGDTTNQQTLARNLVKRALAGDALAIKIVAQIALQLDHDEGDHENQLSVDEQKLIEDFTAREQPTDSMTTEDCDNE